jgi:hypothetical protein
MEAATLVFYSWLAAGTANAATTALLHPLDRLRVVQQLQAPPQGLWPTLRALSAPPVGVLRGLWLPGLRASIAREYLYSGPRIGCYVPLRDALERATGEGRASLGIKLLSGVATGVLGCVIANPIDVVKVRQMHAPGGALGAAALGALPRLYAQEGLAGLYKGLLPSSLRGAAMTVGQIVCYDAAKGHLAASGALPEGPAQHVCASLLAGLSATLLSAPFDVIKTRCMARADAHESIASVLRALWREGALPGSLFRGLLPSYLRQGPFMFLAMPLMEQLRAALGLPYV